MDSETKNILKILGVAVAVLFIFKPKFKNKNISAKSKGENGIEPPKTDNSVTEQEFENATIVLKAFRSAINNGENENELNNLNQMALKDYGIKVSQIGKSGKFVAKNKQGQEIAKEQ